MVQDVMEIGSNKTPERESHDPKVVLESAIKDIVDLRPAHSVEIRSEWKHTLNISVDNLKISRVFCNILDNAFQAMGETGTLWVKTRDCSDRGQPMVEITLGNSGGLIPEADLPHLFESFFTKGKKRGTGLGLAIAKKIVLAHEGRIVCRSTPETGTEFVVYLPASQTKSRPITAQSKEPSHKDLIIHVEDDVFLREAWQSVLGKSITVKSYSSPKAFREALGADPTLKERCRMLLTDYYFDGEDETGADFARNIAASVQCPIILVSDAELDPSESKLFHARIDKTPRTLADLPRLPVPK
jgi:hypothetical protein